MFNFCGIVPLISILWTKKNVALSRRLELSLFSYINLSRFNNGYIVMLKYVRGRALNLEMMISSKIKTWKVLTLNILKISSLPWPLNMPKIGDNSYLVATALPYTTTTWVTLLWSPKLLVISLNIHHCVTIVVVEPVDVNCLLKSC